MFILFLLIALVSVLAECRCQSHSSAQRISFERKGEQVASNVGMRYRLNLAEHWTGVSELLLQCKVAPCVKNTRKTGLTDGLVQV
jgi:hypothetical protein